MKEKFLEVTYPSFLQYNWILSIWKRYVCRYGFHLFDECQSDENHYLFCDACGLSIHIAEKNEFNFD